MCTKLKLPTNECFKNKNKNTRRACNPSPTCSFQFDLNFIEKKFEHT